MAVLDRLGGVAQRGGDVPAVLVELGRRQIGHGLRAVQPQGQGGVLLAGAAGLLVRHHLTRGVPLQPYVGAQGERPDLRGVHPQGLVDVPQRALPVGVGVEPGLGP